MSQEKVLKAFNDLKEAKVINTDRYIAECQSCRQSILKEVKEEQIKLLTKDSECGFKCDKCEFELHDLCSAGRIIEYWKSKGVE